MYLLHLLNASGGVSLEFGLFAAVSKKTPVMLTGEGIVGAAGVGVERVALEWNLFLVDGGVAWLRRTCRGSLG